MNRGEPRIQPANAARNGDGGGSVKPAATKPT
jgi:hypothetical protein